MGINLPGDFLWHVAIRAAGAKAARQTTIITAIAPLLQPTLLKYGIDNDYRAVYWAGQCCHESDQFCTAEEYASGAAYEGRKDLGNTQAGDGKRFKGRGFIQLTGRANYLAFGKMAGLDLIARPELAAEPANALILACLYWQWHELSDLADAEDLEGITRKINGGLNGLDAREAATDRAFRALGYQTTA